MPQPSGHWLGEPVALPMVQSQPGGRAQPPGHLTGWPARSRAPHIAVGLQWGESPSPVQVHHSGGLRIWLDWPARCPPFPALAACSSVE